MSKPRRPGPLHGLWVAAGFLTRIPVGDVSRDGSVEVDTARAVPWFPLVGLAIGAIHGGTFFLASEFFAPLVAAGLATGISLLITGAFHHDGLADIADAFGGGWSVEERMIILKDSRLGTYGVSALAVALILEVVAVAQLSPSNGFRALIVAHVLGRAMALVAMLLAPRAGEGMGASYMERLFVPHVLLSVLASIALTIRVAPGFWPATLIAAAIAAVAVVALAIRKIGGVNGDVLGAVAVVSGLAVVVLSGSI